MLHPEIVPYQSKISGRGLRAKAVILKDEIIWAADPNEADNGWHFTLNEILAWPESKQVEFFCYAYQVGDDLWSGGIPEDDIALLMNHSCDPNTWFVSDAIMTARRDIQVDEEITYDYSTSETARIKLDCLCGSPQCRKMITGKEYLEAWYRERYAEHCLSYISRKLSVTVEL